MIKALSYKIILILLVLICGSAVKTPEEVIDAFTNSVSYNTDTGVLSFTVPESLPDNYELRIFVSGRVRMEEHGASVHPFNEESMAGNWELGKTYKYEFEKDSMLGAGIVIGLISLDDTEMNYEKYVDIDENGVISIE